MAVVVDKRDNLNRRAIWGVRARGGLLGGLINGSPASGRCRSVGLFQLGLFRRGECKPRQIGGLSVKNQLESIRQKRSKHQSHGFGRRGRGRLGENLVVVDFKPSWAAEDLVVVDAIRKAD